MKLLLKILLAVLLMAYTLFCGFVFIFVLLGFITGEFRSLEPLLFCLPLIIGGLIHESK